MTLTQILQKIRAAFYTKAETDTKLNGKSNTNHNHNSAYLGIKAKAESAKSADSVAWANVSGKPTKVSQFTNDSGYITSSGSCNYANSAGSAPANGGTSTASAYLNNYETLQYGVNRLQYFNTNTHTTNGASNVANPTQDWYYHIIQSHANSVGYYFDIASHFQSNSVYYRRIAEGQESGWIQFIDSGNIGSQSVNYANLAGRVAWSGISNKPSTYPPSSHTHDDRYYTESEVNNLLGGKAASNHNHNGTYIQVSASCNKNWNWSGQGGQPTWLWGGEDGTNMYVYNPSNFSVNYANSSGNADTVDGSHAWQMQTLSAGGNTHGSVNWLMQCQHKADGENYFKLYVGDKSIGTKVDRASSAAYAERSMNNGPFYISGYQIYVG